MEGLEDFILRRAFPRIVGEGTSNNVAPAAISTTALTDRERIPDTSDSAAVILRDRHPIEPRLAGVEQALAHPDHGRGRSATLVRE